MIEEHKRIYRISLVLVLIAAAVSLPIDRTVSMGLLLGIALYFLYLQVLSRTVTAQLEAAVTGRGAIPMGFFLRMAVLAAPLLIAAFNQDRFNILAAFAPLFINHIVTFVLYAREEPAA